jgi:hypothetical protein
MAEGSLTGYIYRPGDGRTEPAERIYWTNVHFLGDAHRTGKCWVLAGGAPVEGRVRIKRADLEMVLAGRPAPLARKRGSAGRKANREIDNFWIEVCRVLYHGSVGEDQAELTRRMGQWAIDHMKSPYDAETIRKKMSALLKAIR